MFFLKELWVPIALSALACFILSALAWTVAPHHQGEWKRLPTEPDVLDALRKDLPKPGLYAFPFAMRNEMERADVKVAFERGPVGYIAIANRRRPSMPRMLAAMALYFAVISTVVGYVAWEASPFPKLGAPPMHIARITFLFSLFAYAAAALPDSVWFGRPWRAFFGQLVDALLYAMATAALFAMLWPL